MNPKITYALAICLICLIATNWLTPEKHVSAKPLLLQETDGIHFHTDYNEALREARKTRKPIFLEFRCAP